MLALIFYLAYNILGVPPTQEVYCHECEVAKQKIVKPKTELQCLTEVLYFESRSLGPQGMAMVAQATLNRHRVFLGTFKTICDMVYAPSIYKEYYRACTYSFTCDRKSENMAEPKARHKAHEVAKNALNGKYKNITAGTHFLNCDLASRVSWTKKMKPAGTDGVHCYYY